MIFGLAYSSRAVDHLDEDALLELAEVAATKNEQLGITGYLYYRDKLFLQYLEGEQCAVEKLMAKITDAPRHQILTSIPVQTESKRIFPRWYMRFLGSNPPINRIPSLEDEFQFILDTTASEQYESKEVADAILYVTQRIALLDW